MLVAPGVETGGAKRGEYDSAKFEYDRAADEVICPQGQRLKFEGGEKEGCATAGGAQLSLHSLCAVSGAGVVQPPADGAKNRDQSAARGDHAPTREARRSGEASVAASTQSDHRAGVRHHQTSHGLPALDGAGTGKRPHAVGAAVHGL